MSTYQLNIDSTQAEAGAERIEKSFDRIRAAAGRMEQSVVQSAQRMVAAYNQLNQIKTVKQEAITRLSALSGVLSNFKGPTKVSTENTTRFLRALSQFSNFKLPSIQGLASFLAATGRYNGPTPQAGKNLGNVLKALSAFTGVTGLNTRLVSFMQALASFRGPTANAGRNTERLFAALKTFTGLPRGFSQATQAFIAFSAAIDKAAASYRNLHAVSSQRISGPRAGSIGSVDTTSVRRATRDFGLLETAVFRTRAAFSGLGGVLAAGAIIQASNDILRVRAQLYAATGSIAAADVQMRNLIRTADVLGLEFTSLSRSYALFLGSIKGSTYTIGEAQRIFEGFAVAGRAMQLSTQDIDGIFRALGQIISKGKLQAEELRGQLGDRLPGAFARMAAALGLTTRELDAQMKKGLISGARLQQGLLAMSETLRVEFTQAAEESSKTVDAAFNRLKNAFTFAASGLGTAGLNEALIDISDGLRRILESEGFGNFMSSLGKIFKFVGDNANFFAAALGGAAVAASLKWTLAAAQSLNIAGAFTEALAAARAASAATGVATTALVPPLVAAQGAMTRYAGSVAASTIPVAAFNGALDATAVNATVAAPIVAAATGEMAAAATGLTLADDALIATTGHVTRALALEAETSYLAAGGLSGLNGATRQLAVTNGITATATQAQTGATVQATAATGALTGATITASGAMAFFRTILMTIPFVAIGLLIFGLISYMSSLKTQAELAADAIKDLGAEQNTASQITSDYTSYIMNNTDAILARNNALRESIVLEREQKMEQARNAQLDGATYRQFRRGQAIAGTGSVTQVYTPDGVVPIETGMSRARNNGGAITLENGQTLTADQYNVLTRELGFGVRNGRLVAGEEPRNLEQARRTQQGLLRAQQYYTLMPEGAARDVFGQAVTIKETQLNAAALQDRDTGGRLGIYDFQQRLGAAMGNLARTGSDPGDSEDGSGSSSPAGAAAARQDEQDIRRALESVRDLNRQIYASNQAITALGSNTASAVATQARAAAVAQLDNFSDSFATVERAQQGIVDFSAQLKGQAQQTVDAVQQANALIESGTANPGTATAEQLRAAEQLVASYSTAEIDAARAMAAANISGYQESKDAALNYLTALQQIRAEREKELDITQDLAQQRIRLASMNGEQIPGYGTTRGVDLVGATEQGGRALREARFEQEALTEAIGVSAENYEDYVRRLVDAKRAQDDFNRSLEHAQYLHDQVLAQEELSYTTGLYAAGGQERDIAAMRELYNLQQSLIDQGYGNQMVNERVAARAETLRLGIVVEEVTERYQKLQQVGQDVTDVIVDGFREAAESGQSLGKTLKSIFSDLKRTILDFVLYNPLKQFLQQTVTNALSRSFSVTTGINTGTNGAPVASIGGVATLLSSVLAPTSAAGTMSAAERATIQSSATGVNTSDPNVIVVTGSAGAGTPRLNGIPQFNTASSNPFAMFTPMFQWQDRETTDAQGNTITQLGNLSRLKNGLGDIGKVFSKDVRGVGAKLQSLGQGIGQVAQVAGSAYAAFSSAKAIGKALGLGRTGSNVMGGAAAGFTVGGPIGAGIGATIALVGSLLTRKSPQAQANVVVGADGRAALGTATSKDGGNLTGVKDSANASTSLFSRVADQLGSYLKAGNYGYFGEADKIKGDTKTYYSTTGAVDKKGRPLGTAGVDYMIGTGEQLAAFALKQQINSGKYGDLNPIYQQIARNSTATTGEDLMADLGVGESYLAFVDAANQLTDLEQQTKDLTKSYDSLVRRSRQLGLSTTELTTAYEKLRAAQKKDFNFSISQGILGIKDPIMAEWNQLLKDYEISVRDATAVGGDLAKVEEYYGLLRVELMKKYAEQSNDVIRKSAMELYRQLTATESSPLSPYTIFKNAQTEYQSAMAALQGGDYSNYDKFETVTQDYLQSAQTLFSSSTDFFDIFRQVTDFLQYVGSNAPIDGVGTNPQDLPALPSISAIQQQILDANNAVVANTQNIGINGVETNTLLTDLTTQIGNLNNYLRGDQGTLYDTSGSLRTLQSV